jgi:transporter family protein
MHSWVLYAVLSAVFAALVAILGKMGIASVDPTLATAVRAVIMAVFLVLAVLFLGKGSLLSSVDGKAFQFIVLSGAAGALSWFFYFIALKNGPAHGVAALDRLSVVLVLILAALFLGEGITWKSALGALLMTLGAIFMVL